MAGLSRILALSDDVTGYFYFIRVNIHINSYEERLDAFLRASFIKERDAVNKWRYLKLQGGLAV